MAADLKARTADIGADCELSEPARLLLAGNPGPGDYLEALRDQKLGPDALDFVAHWLPKREAVWWGCLCIWHAGRPTLPAPAEAALRAVVRWVQDPAESKRRVLEEAAEAAGSTYTPAGGLAYATFFSGGSLAPAGLPVVPPPPTLMADTLAKVLLLAAVHKDSGRTNETHEHFLELGLEVAGGKNRWA